MHHVVERRAGQLLLFVPEKGEARRRYVENAAFPRRDADHVGGILGQESMSFFARTYGFGFALLLRHIDHRFMRQHFLPIWIIRYPGLVQNPENIPASGEKPVLEAEWLTGLQACFSVREHALHVIRMNAPRPRNCRVGIGVGAWNRLN